MSLNSHRPSSKGLAPDMVPQPALVESFEGSAGYVGESFQVYP